MSDDTLLRRRAARLARPLALAPDEGAAAISVQIGDQTYAFPLADVQRAAVIAAVTPLPHVPPTVLGLGVLDGNVLAVFDGRSWAGAPRRTQLERIPVLLLGAAAAPLALAVDAFGSSVVVPAQLSRAASAPPWLHGLTETGLLVVRVAALVEDPLFTLGNRPTEETQDDHHQED